MLEPSLAAKVQDLCASVSARLPYVGLGFANILGSGS